MSDIYTWSISKELFKETFKGRPVTLMGNYINFGEVSVRYFQSDCGTVQLANARGATPEVLDDVRLFCRKSGYSVIIGTLTGVETKHPYLTSISKIVAMYEKAGYTVTSLGNSHRNPQKKHYLVHLRIPESEFKVFCYDKEES